MVTVYDGQSLVVYYDKKVVSTSVSQVTGMFAYRITVLHSSLDARGRASFYQTSRVQGFERSNGLDTALYKNIFYSFPVAGSIENRSTPMYIGFVTCCGQRGYFKGMIDEVSRILRRRTDFVSTEIPPCMSRWTGCVFSCNVCRVGFKRDVN